MICLFGLGGLFPDGRQVDPSSDVKRDKGLVTILSPPRAIDSLEFSR